MSENLKKIDEILADFSAGKNVRKPMLAARVVNYWPELMGHVVEKYTQKIYVQNNTLFVKVGPSALKSELMYSKETIIEKYNLKFGAKTLVNLVVL